MIYNDITETIGLTPLVRLGNLKKELNLYGDEDHGPIKTAPAFRIFAIRRNGSLV